MNYEFYEIQSKLSQPLPGQPKKVSLGCIGHPEIKIFIWFEPTEGLAIHSSQKATHIQLLFEECILDWKKEVGLRLEETNRRNITLDVFGSRKGSRTTKMILEKAVYQKSQEILQQAYLPPEHKEVILQLLTE